MAFRADVSADQGFQSLKNYFISREIQPDERERSEYELLRITEKYGPVINSYPTWHPLVSHHGLRDIIRTPNERCGYFGLDHTRYFVNAFISCPYNDGQEIIDSVEAFPYNSVAEIKAERLAVKLYDTNATPILVTCEWKKSLYFNQMIPDELAIPLMLKKEIPCHEWSENGETWEMMRPYFLGTPHGSRSSLFVNQDTALTMKKIWNLLINTGMYGPVMVDGGKYS